MKDIAMVLQNVPEKVIFVCSSPYNILVAASLISQAKLYGRCGVVLPTYSQKNVEYFGKIALKLEKIGVVCEVIDKKNMFYRAIGLADRENNKVMDNILQRLGTKRNEYFLVNHTWNNAMVCYPASLWFKYCKEAIFIEEGYTQTVSPPDKPFIAWLKKLYGNQLEFWLDERLKGIYVHNIDLFQAYPLKLFKQFSIQGNLNEIEKNNLFDLFFADAESRKEIDILEKQCFAGIIFTQPLSEDRYTTEKEKVRIYADIARFYSRYGTVCLKVHPRDATKYSMDGVFILKGSYPSELLAILGIRFKFAVGLCTSAVETVDADVRLNLNENFLKELTYELAEL